ncbi:MAG: hypothetical protein ACYC23_04360 [Limisphaerales bacterium]
MNAATARQSSGWTQSRWVTTIGTLFLGQVAVIFWFSAGSGPGPAAVGTLGRTVLVTDPASQRALEELPWLADPAQFALMNPRGFSSEVWRRQPVMNARDNEGTEPPRWLKGEPARLGSSLAPPRIPAAALAQVAERPVPVFPGRQRQPRMEAERSALRVEGDLAGRPWQASEALPAFPHNDVLQSTTVQVVVNDHGAVLSATLWGTSSGLAAADQKALELARALRFDAVAMPDRRGSLSWGHLVFRWGTIPTGASAGAAPPSS